MVTCYEAGIPVMPRMCPFGGDGRMCRVGRHMKRDRCVGPGFALIVAVCREHGTYFTLYPPGWTPYGREPVVDVEPTWDRPKGRAWSKSIFAVCLAAAALQMWPRESVGAPACGLTQTRRIRRCGQWLGLSGSVSMAEMASVGLGTPLATHLERQRCFSRSSKRLAQGRAVAELLDWVPNDEGLWHRLLAVGSMTGACGRAWSCDRSGVLQPVFRS